MRERRATAKRRRAWKRAGIGNCLTCGARLTYCGLPFSADIACRLCLSVNRYLHSQQPIAIVKSKP